MNATGGHPMNDEQVLTAVRRSLIAETGDLAGMDMGRPAEEVMARGQVLRHRILRRRRAFGLAGALAVAAALAVTALLPGSHQPSVRLAAWTVAEQPGGNISVTIRELQNPAGLQSKLRADGVPASVTFIGHQNPSCQTYPASLALISEVFPSQGPPPGPSGVIVINPSARPAGTGVYLDATQQPQPAGASISIGVGLVHASQLCTGS
jgi:hypothetical protein